MLWTLHALLLVTSPPLHRVWECGKAGYAMNFPPPGAKVTRSFLVAPPLLHDIVLPFKAEKQTKEAFEPFHHPAVLALFAQPV